MVVMKCTMTLSCSLLFGSLVLAGAAPQTDFKRYDVILQRQPFGRAPIIPEVVPIAEEIPVAQVDPANAFIRDLKLVGLYETDQGIRVGFIDIKRSPPRNYFLYRGESEDGIDVVDVDYEKDKVQLQKGAEIYWLSMSGATAGGASGASEPARASVARATSPRRRVIGPAARAGFSRSATQTGSYAERLARRRKEQEAERERLRLEAKMTGKKLEDHLNKIQMDIIRQGGPPLPIPLTQEMDDQLVAEGVLPPLE